MPSAFDNLKSRFGKLDRDLSEEYQNEPAIRTLVEYFEHYSNHLSRRTEVASRAGYMDILQASAKYCSCFLGCSRVSARELLRGNFPGRLFSPIDYAWYFARFVIMELSPTLVTSGTIWWFVLTKVLNHLALPPLDGAWTLLVFVVWFKWMCSEYSKYKGTVPRKSVSREDARHITQRFLEYDEKLARRPQSQYPAVRVFLLESDKIKADRKKFRLPDGTVRSWWELMVEEHAKRNIEIALIELTPMLKQTHPALAHQFSLFVVPGDGGWVIECKDDHLEANVHLSVKGKEINHTYGCIMRDVRAIAKKFIVIKGTVAEASDQRIPDLTMCLNCKQANGQCHNEGIQCQNPTNCNESDKSSHEHGSST